MDRKKIAKNAKCGPKKDCEKREMQTEKRLRKTRGYDITDGNDAFARPIIKESSMEKQKRKIQTEGTDERTRVNDAGSLYGPSGTVPAARDEKGVSLIALLAKEKETAKKANSETVAAAKMSEKEASEKGASKNKTTGKSGRPKASEKETPEKKTSGKSGRPKASEEKVVTKKTGEEKTATKKIAAKKTGDGKTATKKAATKPVATIENDEEKVTAKKSVEGKPTDILSQQTIEHSSEERAEVLPKESIELSSENLTEALPEESIELSSENLTEAFPEESFVSPEEKTLPLADPAEAPEGAEVVTALEDDFEFSDDFSSAAKTSETSEHSDETGNKKEPITEEYVSLPQETETELATAAAGSELSEEADENGYIAASDSRLNANTKRKRRSEKIEDFFSWLKKNWAMASLFAILLIALGVGISFLFRAPAGDIPTGFGKEELVFSKESGFYPNKFELVIYSNGGTVYYTTDGSIPTKDSERYIQPIVIDDATTNRNVYAERTDITTLFLPEANGEYRVPDYLIDKCNVIRAVCYYPDGSVSPVKTASYFVGFDEKEGYGDFRIISLVTDPANLFDYETGIYVCGKTFADFKAEQGDAMLLTEPRTWLANYYQKGREWERPATVQIFRADHTTEIDKEIGIRVRGGSSRGLLPRSLNFYARKEYDGISAFSTYFFSTDYLPQRITLFSGGNATTTKFYDELAATLCRDLPFSTMEYTPAVLFLNGEYWGAYQICEKYDEDYLSYHYNVDKNNVLLVKNNACEAGDERDMVLYTEMKTFISTSDMTDAKLYAKAKNLIDMDSYLSYYASQIYFARYGDWPVSNFALWRAVTPGEGKYNDGKWRYMLYDANLGAMELPVVTFNTIPNVLQDDAVFASLYRNAEFRAALKGTLLALCATFDYETKVKPVLDQIVSRWQEPIKKDVERFYGKNSPHQNDFLTEVNAVAEFFKQRKAVIQKIVTAIP